MPEPCFKMPAVIRVSRATGQIIGIEYAEIPASEIAGLVRRIDGVLSRPEHADFARMIREETKEGAHHVEV